MENTIKYVHICESCHKTETLTPEDAFNLGWDYPPNMGAWGVVSPRTCPECNIDTTLWWALMCEHKTMEQLTPNQRNTFERIISEPASVTPES